VLLNKHRISDGGNTGGYLSFYLQPFPVIPCQLFSAPMYEILVFCSTVRCPCSGTSARLPVYASITFEGCIRSGIMPVSYGTTCDITRHHTHWLLQLNPCRSTCMQTGATATSAKCSMVFNLDRRALISPALQQLHWLPVMHCVTFKIATLLHQVLQKCCPSYRTNL